MTLPTTHPLLPEATEWLRQLVSFNTISRHSNLELIEAINQHLQASLHLESQVRLNPERTKANLLASIGPVANDGVVLSGHTDVVDVADQDWHSDPFALKSAPPYLYGRGTCDMKGFIACALAMAPEFARAPLKKPVHLAFSRDEEIGCLGADDMLDMLRETGMRPAAAVVGEPTCMEIIAGHKGGIVAHTSFHGVPAHSSMPEEGISSIPFAARFVTHLSDLEQEMALQSENTTKYQQFNVPYGTINAGVIQGGTALNIFAARCQVDWHYRSMPGADLELFQSHLEAWLNTELEPAMQERHRQAGIENIIEASYPGLTPLTLEQSPALSLAAQLTGSQNTGVLSIGTEAGFFQNGHIPAVVIGPGDLAQAHKPNEFVTQEQLCQCLHFLERLCHSLSS